MNPWILQVCNPHTAVLIGQDPKNQREAARQEQGSGIPRWVKSSLSLPSFCELSELLLTWEVRLIDFSLCSRIPVCGQQELGEVSPKPTPMELSIQVERDELPATEGTGIPLTSICKIHETHHGYWKARSLSCLLLKEWGEPSIFFSGVHFKPNPRLSL